MHCLWHWATAKAPVKVDNSEPVMLRRVKGLLCVDLADLEVGGEYKLQSNLLKLLQVMLFALWEHTALRGEEVSNPHPNLCYFCFFVIVPLISCQTDFYHRNGGWCGAGSAVELG